MPSVDIVLELTAGQCQTHYAGAAEQIRTTSVDGRRVWLPARALRGVVGRNGVHGIYRLSYDAQGRFISLAPVSTR